MAIKGYGNMVMFDDDGKLFVDRLSEIIFNADTQNRDVDGYPFDNPDGLLQIVDSFITREEFSCQVSTGSFDKITLSRVFDQYLTKTASLSLPHAQQLSFGSSPVEIAIAGLTADQEVGVFYQSDTAPVQFTQKTTAPAAAGEYQVTAGKVVGHSSDAGKKVIVNYFKTYTDIETMGETNKPIGNLGFTGRLIGPRFAIGPQFYIPKMSRVSGFSFGGETSQITYRATISGNFAKPIIFAFDVPLVAA